MTFDTKKLLSVDIIFKLILFIFSGLRLSTSWGGDKCDKRVYALAAQGFRRGDIAMTKGDKRVNRAISFCHHLSHWAGDTKTIAAQGFPAFVTFVTAYVSVYRKSER